MGRQNPHIVVQRLHQVQFSINVWAGIIGDNIIRPYLLPERLTGNLYRPFLENILPVPLEDLPLGVRQHMWFIYDGAPSHYTHMARNYLNTVYTNRWIGHGGPILWPARSPDLNPLGFYPWGHLKTLVYDVEV